MTRHAFKVGAIAVAATLVLPSLVLAYFPPTIGMPPPVGVKSVPPDPFPVPGAGGLGEPDAPEPGPGPTVQTPEPATVVTGLVGLAMAGGFGLRKRMKARA
jgi:PEP-CTERM motif